MEGPTELRRLIMTSSDDSTGAIRMTHNRPKTVPQLTPDKLPIGYAPVAWGELNPRLQAAGFVEPRRGTGRHRQFVHPDNGRVVTVSVHTTKEVGTGLARRILKEAG
jgi:predicted RNA binding protein YcfA (HicA-like mRNA interferase family)